MGYVGCSDSVRQDLVEHVVFEADVDEGVENGKRFGVAKSTGEQDGAEIRTSELLP